MANPQLSELFSSGFKFKINQEVRHKGDNKKGNPDMGLLVVRRLIEEMEDESGSSVFQKIYVCRMVKFSGSGELASFQEAELLSIEEHEVRCIEDENWRNEVRSQIKETQEEIYGAFGVNRKSELYLLVNGEPDKSEIYVVAGYHLADGEIPRLSLRNKLGIGKASIRVEVSSKTQFAIIAAENNGL
jgi:hypothetical protein